MTKAYYNEHDPKSAAWLRELIKQGHIAPGDVDERSIEDVLPSELAGYTQCHFFAGIGVWSYALRQAGWPDDRPVWTGSCPCQPFSQAGKRGGTSDERHLWPAFQWLISQRKPNVVLGEQVASPDGLAWLDIVQSDMEAASYTFGAVDLCAAGVGSPHLRQRLYFVADTESVRGRERQPDTGRCINGSSEGQGAVIERDCTTDQLADASINRHDGRRSGEASNGTGEPERSRNAGILDFPLSARLQGHIGNERDGNEPGRNGTDQARPVAEAGPTNGFWRNAEWIYCRDGKWRATEPGTYPLVNGATARVGRLRGYGNAIVAPVAEAFIRAYLDR